MRYPSSSHENPDLDPPLTQPEREQVWRALDDLLHSQPLRSTAQCQHLMRYIVEHTLSGEPALLRERVIGKEVFGRRADYEPGEDPVVRIRAADLRKRLALYYQSLAEVPEIRIDVPSGSYRATFTWHRHSEPPPLVQAEKTIEPATHADAASIVGAERVEVPMLSAAEPTAVLPTPTPEPAADLSDKPRSPGWRLGGWVAACLMLLACLALGGWWYLRASDPVRQFWGPMITDSRPVLISIGSNAVYRVGDREIDAYIAQTGRDHQSSEGMEIYPPFRPDQTLASTGLYATPDSFVAIGDVAAASQMITTLTRYGKEIEERFPNDISFGEVREHPTILIGGANNPMTRELTRSLPFARKGRNRIEDRDHPGKAWELHAAPDLHDTDDYAIITRLVRKGEASPMVSVAGLGGHGTLAAAEFLCKPEGVKALRDRLGRNWMKQNFQVVLHIKILDFKPAETVIVDQRLW